jgi:hypothetical protein
MEGIKLNKGLRVKVEDLNLKLKTFSTLNWGLRWVISWQRYL